MDREAVNRALAAVRRSGPHLPNGPDLVDPLHAAWTGGYDASAGVQREAMAAVLAVAWRTGQAAGAARGHQVAAGWLRDAVADTLAEHPAAGPDGRWLLHAATRAAERLGEAPALSRARPVPPFVAGDVWTDERAQFVAPLWVGLDQGWRTGHRDAVDAAVETLLDDVLDLLGDDAVITTFLDAATPAYRWLELVADTVIAVGAADEEHPPALAAPSQPSGGPVVARAFSPPRLDPLARPSTRRRPPPGPGRRFAR